MEQPNHNTYTPEETSETSSAHEDDDINADLASATFENLTSFVISWARSRDIFEQGSFKAQIAKFAEESAETVFAAGRVTSEKNFPWDGSALEEFKDGIGDTLVTIIVSCSFIGLDPVRCLEHAYKEIRERKGKMIAGTFVKEAS
mgnify:CR=1 FL=1